MNATFRKLSIRHEKVTYNKSAVVGFTHQSVTDASRIEIPSEIQQKVDGTLDIIFPDKDGKGRINVEH